MSQQGSALRKLRNAWDNARGFFEELGGEIDPPQATSIFVHDNAGPATPGATTFNIKPITFVVPERANSPYDQIFIVAQGRIGICTIDANALNTKDFSTEVAYFRRQDDGDRNSLKLDHVYGAHFDYAPGQPGHPLFHAQMNDMDELKKVVEAKYRVPTDNGSNFMSSILRNTRLPTAQMDMFAFMLQVAADHLICEVSTPAQMKTLKDLADEVSAVKGTQDLIQAITNNQCTRSVHWYA
ncbi:hypothetical protein XA1311A_19470 [Xanthomonas arboricola]|uniref:hypothetical protein n=1 Tax=Xanthomonas arboricola TaxID=56448 RepID=UPI001E5DC291|nr:hypothetical protein [Xanthomonas arboricola]CAE6762306.1 hypothetical protein XA1311A_19470 [Xanthomonas arboricola]CAE6762320.1 hypothetical protein XA1311A_19470 [Xanthomonas arboricola]